MSKRLMKCIWAMGAFCIVVNIYLVYFVRELLAAELLFGLFLGTLMLVGLVLYLIQQVGKLGLIWARPVVRALAQTSRQGWSYMKGISRKPLRHPDSESAH